MTDPAPQTPPPARKPGRALRWLLVVSLALNLVFLGLAAGGAARMWRAGPAAQPAPMAELQLLWRALPEEDRRAMRGGDGARHADRDTGRTGTEGRRESRSEARARVVADVAALRALLLAEPFDRAALEARLSRARDLQAERAGRALARMLDRIEAMDRAERARMVERLDRRLSRHDRREGRD
jgi:uncharacterized membrane protein